MPTFHPEDPRKLATQGLLLPGEYDFEVLSADPGISKAKNEMLKLKLSIFHGERKVSLYDYLVFSENGMSKLYGFCLATGLEEKYQKGEINANDVIRRCGKVFIKIDDKDPEYEPKNAVGRYVKPKVKKEVVEPTKPDVDPDIPF
jgi:hypothetical protein